MNTFVLIVVLITHVNSGDVTNEINIPNFTDLSLCQNAMNSIISQAEKRQNVDVFISGCYKQ